MTENDLLQTKPVTLLSFKVNYNYLIIASHQSNIFGLSC